ncbi:MAG: helix-turn-helix domain-containing protein [Burkholderiales bacterium]|nr:helix-turn-helix domain-containing protein [Burkholderiales bacterium]
MRYEEFAAPPALAAHVHCLWRFEGEEAGVEQAVPPDGRPELIVHAARPYEERGADGAWRVQPPLLFAGQLTRPLLLRSRGEVTVLGVRFRPAGAWAFAGRPLSTCTDRRIDLAALHGDADVAALHRSLATAPPEARLELVSSYVARQLARHDGRRDAAVERCVERLLSSEGRVPLAELGTLAGLGERHLQRRFAEVVGISPRSLGVVIRLRRVFEALREAPLATWSERAQAAGFFDHPQMARDFRRLLGKTPTRWAEAGPGLAASLADADT